MHSEDVDVRGRWKTKSGGGNSSKVVDQQAILSDVLTLLEDDDFALDGDDLSQGTAESDESDVE